MQPDRFERAERRAWWWPVTVAPVITSAALILWLVNIVNGQTLGHLTQILLLIAGVLSALSAIGVSIRMLYLERQARTNAVAIIKKNLDDVVGPVIRRVGGIVADAHSGASADVLRDKQEQLREYVLGLSRANIRHNAERCRAMFYSLHVDNHNVRTLSLKGHPVGRENGQGPGPVENFGEDTQIGRRFINLVENRGAQLIEDVDHENFDAFSFASTGCASLACAAVFAGNRRVGLLMIDSEEVCGVGQGDLELIRALAQLLGSALVIQGGNSTQAGKP